MTRPRLAHCCYLFVLLVGCAVYIQNVRARNACTIHRDKVLIKHAFISLILILNIFSLNKIPLSLIFEALAEISCVAIITTPTRCKYTYIRYMRALIPSISAMIIFPVRVFYNAIPAGAEWKKDKKKKQSFFWILKFLSSSRNYLCFADDATMMASLKRKTRSLFSMKRTWRVPPKTAC